MLHLTDPHLFADADSSLRGTVTNDSLVAVIDHYRNSNWVADVAVVTGDLIQDDTAAAYERFCRLLSDTELPVHCIPGNHDVRSLMQAALNRPNFHYCKDIVLQNWLIVGIDSCIAGQAGGAISLAEQQRLGSVIENATADHVLVALHHPPLPMNSRWLDTVGLADADTFLKFIATKKVVRGAIFGHVHQAFEARVEDICIIGTPSTCRQFEVGSDDFAVDDSPPAYRRLTLSPDGSIESDLIWT